jgi:carboxymethylenebutenolidase
MCVRMRACVPACGGWGGRTLRTQFIYFNLLWRILRIRGVRGTSFLTLTAMLPRITVRDADQVTGPLERLCRLIASEGFVTIIGECYHELEAPGTALGYDTEGTDRGNAHKKVKTIEAFDSDARAMVDFLIKRDDCNGRVGSVGMCLGGHLALRNAFEPEVLAAVCLFPTDIQAGSLGAKGDDTLARLTAGDPIDTEVTFVFGKQDNHVPAEGRAKIYQALVQGKQDFQWLELNAQHAFIRDELSKGRYDPALAALCNSVMFEIFRRRLSFGGGSSAVVQPQKVAGDPDC